MKIALKKKLMIVLGWFFVILGVIGAILPIMPTTVFLIVALAIFSKSSPGFYKMLINNKWFGAELRQWDESKTISRESKRKATIVIVSSFSVSIGILYQRVGLQLMLVSFAVVLLLIVWNIKESR